MTMFARTSSATTSGASFTSRSGSHRASPSFGECPWNLISTKNKNSFQKLELVLSENPSPTVSVTGGELNGNRDLSFSWRWNTGGTCHVRRYQLA